MNCFRRKNSGSIINFEGMDFACKIVSSRCRSPQLCNHLCLMSVPMIPVFVIWFACPEDRVGYLHHSLSHPGNGLFMGVRGTSQSCCICSPPFCQRIVTLPCCHNPPEPPEQLWCGDTYCLSGFYGRSRYQCATFYWDHSPQRLLMLLHCQTVSRRQVRLLPQRLRHIGSQHREWCLTGSP